MVKKKDQNLAGGQNCGNKSAQKFSPILPKRPFFPKLLTPDLGWTD
jgi:hypothetical protein